MSYFNTNKITKENLAEFAEWLNNNKNNNISNLKFLDNVSLEAISSVIKDEYSLGQIFENIMMDNHNRAAECLEWMDKKAPHISSEFLDGLTYQYRNGYGFSSNYGYELIEKKMAERSVKDNLKIWSNPGTPFFSKNSINTDKTVSKLSWEETNTLNSLFEKDKAIMASAYKDRNSGYFSLTGANDVHNGMQKILNSGVLKNCDTLTPEFRKEVNSHLHIGHYADLEPRFFTKDMVKGLIKNSHIWWQDTHQDTSKAKTQTEKNANILSPEIKKYKDLIMAEVEKISKSNKDYRSEKKGMNESFKELCAEIGITSFHSPSLNMLFLETAKKDIINGQAHKLDHETIKRILDQDRTGFYADKIPEDMANQFQQSNTKSVIKKGKNQDAYTIAREMNDYRTPLSDKKALAEIGSEILKNHAVKKDDYLKKQTEFDKDYKVYSDLCRKALDLEHTLHSVSQLAYSIASLEGKLSPKNLSAEQHLSEEAIEKELQSGFSRDGNAPHISIPEWGRLPLLGRKKEEKRRENVKYAIREVNDKIHRICQQPEQKNALKNYLEGLLSPETIDIMKKDISDLRKQAEKINRDLNLDIRYAEIHKLRQEMEKEERSLNPLSDRVSEVNRKISNLKERKTNFVGTGENLEVVPNGNDEKSAKEKTAVRKRNKERNLDPLAEKAKKKMLEDHVSR